MNENWMLMKAFIRTKCRFPWKNRQALEQWQEKKVQKHLSRLLPQSSFLREQMKDKDIYQWRELPTMDKSIMMENFDCLNTVQVAKKEALELALKSEQHRDFEPMINKITVGLSSGTSGNRGVFLLSKKERMTWAGVILAKVMPKGGLSKHRIAFFHRSDSHLYQSVKRKIKKFQFYDLLRPLSEHIAEMQKHQPTIIVAPPSMLRQLSDQKEQGKLELSPKKIVSVAEVLEPIDRNVMEKVWEQKIHQVYQCTEGFLGTTCSYGTIHLNEDIVLIEKEWVDRPTRRFVPIITDFCRTSQPIVRYRLNDILIERATPCPCGSIYTGLEHIEGRRDDCFYFRSLEDDEQVVIYPDYIRIAVMKSSDHLKSYRVIQELDGSIEIFIQITQKEWESCCKRIASHLIHLCTLKHVKIPEMKFFPFKSYNSLCKMRRIERKI